jgi:hypothetical protein
MTMPDCYIIDDNNQEQNRHQPFNSFTHIDAYRTNNYETHVDLSHIDNKNELASLLTTSVSSSNISSPSSSSPSSPSSSSIIDYNSNHVKSVTNTVNPNDYEMVNNTYLN